MVRKSFNPGSRKIEQTVTFVSGYYPETNDAHEAVRQFLALSEKGAYNSDSTCDLHPSAPGQLGIGTNVVAFPGVKPPMLNAEKSLEIIRSLAGDPGVDFSKFCLITTFQKFRWLGSDDRAEAGMIFMDLLIYKKKPRFFIESRVTLRWLEDPRSPEALVELGKIEKACGLKFDPKKLR